jgi:hypothetical protein
MMLLLSCHCFRLCRLAQRMEASYLASAAGGGGALYPAAKRATPEDVITALPVRRFGSFLRAAAAAKAADGDGGGEVELAASDGGTAGGAGDATVAHDQQRPGAAAKAAGAAAGGGDGGFSGARSEVACVFDAEEPCAVCYEDFQEQEEVKQLPCGVCMLLGAKLGGPGWCARMHAQGTLRCLRPSSR